jgi:macrolide transport system ATP-binding/permease protein
MPFWFRRKRQREREREWEEEIAFDLAAAAEERLRNGLPPDEAIAASKRDFGNALLVTEDVRQTWGWTWLERWGQDLRYGWRSLNRNRLLLGMAALSLALGIGANTAIYSFLDALLIRSLPVRQPDELFIPQWRAKAVPPVIHSHEGETVEEPSGGYRSADFPWPAYLALREHTRIFSSLFAYKPTGRVNLSVQGQAEIEYGEFVSGDFFNGLGVVPAAGRLLSLVDDRDDAPAAIVISHNYWQERFGADPGVIGQVIRINKSPFTIIGVTAAGFRGITPGSLPVLYIPLSKRHELEAGSSGKYWKTRMFTDPHFYWVNLMGRLRPGISRDSAQSELAAVFHHFVLGTAATAAERKLLPALSLNAGDSGVDEIRRGYAKPLTALMFMAALILVIACTNIANLLLARSFARRREIAVRLSLGAGRLRLIRQLLTESVLMAAPGGMLGLIVALIGIRFLNWLFTGGYKEYSLGVQLDWRVLIFATVITLITGIAAGLAPAFAATRMDLTPALKEAGRGTRSNAGRYVSLAQCLMVSQIALAVLLVLAATTFVRSLNHLHQVALGFNQEQLLTFSISPRQAGYQGEALTRLYFSLEDRFQNLPGVLSATVTDTPLVSGWSGSSNVSFPGKPKVEGREGPSAARMVVSGSFFRTMQLPVIAGRPLGPEDRIGTPLAAVVNEVFVRKFFPGQNPLGQRFSHGNSSGELTIVGVAKNAQYNSLKQPIPPLSYTAMAQNVFGEPPAQVFFELRTAGRPLALVNTIRQMVHDAAPDVPVTDVMTQSERIDSTIIQERTFSHLCSLFASLALAIACVGLYATISYSVSRRTNEIGVRLALGAERRSIVWLVLRNVIVLGCTGLTIGVVCAWNLRTAVQSFVFGMKPMDLFTLFWTVAVLSVIVLLAGFAPASRASRIDPMRALRHE